MGNTRVLLYITLFFISYLIWAQWQMEYGPAPVANETVNNNVQQTESVDSSIPQADTIDETAAHSASATTPASADTVQASAQRIHVKTDVIEAEIDTLGGDIKQLVLLDYLVTASNAEEKIHLLDATPENFQIVQSGLVSAKKETAPSHNNIFKPEKLDYQLADGEDSIEIPLYWQSENGVKVKKLITFKRNDYEIDVSYFITAGDETWTGSDYMQVVRTPPSTEGNSAFIRTYTGGILYNEEIKYEKYDFDDLAEKNLKLKLKDGWLAMIDHYFITAWIPQPAEDNLYYSRFLRDKNRYILGVRSPAEVVKPGETIEIKNRLVAGPKLQYKLEEIQPGLELTVDYGVLTIIAKPLFWLLDTFHSMTGNWGWAIILLTISVKLLFYKLSEMSYRSMARMRVVAPRIKQMKERFGDDRQAMSKAMMDMYKKEKINPMGGCLPILVQMPVFISLYWVLLGSVEMRHAPFILWLTNLTDKDPYFVLPVLMGISMFIQQKLNPAPVDPIQQKVFQVMPFAFTFMFAFFPSGLVLYWVVNNILSIAQQYVITKRIEQGKS